MMDGVIKVGLGIMIKDENKVLLGHRCEDYGDTGGIYEPGSWTFPGGKQEYNETIFEEARIAYMDEMDFPYSMVEEAGIISPVLAVECEYKSMTHFGDRVIIEVKLISFNGIKYALSYNTVPDEYMS